MQLSDQPMETATTAPSGARQFVRESLTNCPGSTVDEATLLVSEITTTAMALSGASAVRVNVRRSIDAVRVEVHEPPSRTDHHRYDDVSGFSAGIVEAIADRWGIDDVPGGRIVWFELAVRRRN